MKFVTRSISPLEDPLSHDPTAVWMSPRLSLWGWGEASTIGPGTGAGRIDDIRRSFLRLAEEADVDDPLNAPGTGPVAFVSTTFATGSTGSTALVPEVVVGHRGDEWWVTECDGATLPPPRPPSEPPSDRARYAGSSVPDVEWLEAVAEALRRIDEGEMEKVVLARDYAVWSRSQFRPSDLLAHLNRRFPSCYLFAVAGLVGASPELLVSRRGLRLESLTLAGSAPVFDDAEADRAAGAALLASAKNRWEHQLAVDSVLASLEPVITDLHMPPEPVLLRLDNVQHLATPLSGTVDVEWDALSLAARLHPTAAVGGTPTPAALAAIVELEGMDRGRYAGPVGWTDTRGDGDLAIALRCAELSGARARLFAGAGIVAGSLPEDELEETRLKLKAMMGALGAD